MARRVLWAKALAVIAIVAGAATAAAQSVNTLEYRPVVQYQPGSVEARIFQLAKESGLILTNEAVTVLSAAGGINSQILVVMRKLPVIHLVVSPVPPRDYTVVINGKQYEATEESKYGVQPGPVELAVQRESRPPCTHKLVVEKDQTVHCRM